MVPGWVGALAIVTVRACCGELPQLLSAVTEMEPLVVPAVTVIVLVLLEPVHEPPGSVQV